MEREVDSPWGGIVSFGSQFPFASATVERVPQDVNGWNWGQRRVPPQLIRDLVGEGSRMQNAPLIPLLSVRVSDAI